ncbi:hypothetical protein HAV15_011254 [Penicillium sp. str. |nr:hypothetical protein HAV15_011254 [Penicillium sp. str. \
MVPLTVWHTKGTPTDSAGLYREKSQQGEWGNWYWAIDDSKVWVRIPMSVVSLSNGKLNNGDDTNFRAISSTWPVFVLIRPRLGRFFARKHALLLGLTQDEAIQYEGASPICPSSLLVEELFHTELAALSFFHKDYTESSNVASSLDRRVAQDSIATAGQDYLIVTSLSRFGRHSVLRSFVARRTKCTCS